MCMEALKKAHKDISKGRQKGWQASLEVLVGAHGGATKGNTSASKRAKSCSQGQIG